MPILALDNCRLDTHRPRSPLMQVTHLCLLAAILGDSILLCSALSRQPLFRQALHPWGILLLAIPMVPPTCIHRRLLSRSHSFRITTRKNLDQPQRRMQPQDLTRIQLAVPMGHLAGHRWERQPRRWRWRAAAVCLGHGQWRPKMAGEEAMTAG